MNGRKAKRLRKHATQLLIRWIRSMTPDGEDATKITKKNLHLVLIFFLIVNIVSCKSCRKFKVSI